MTAPRICVAGIDVATERHIRPTTPANDPITRSLLEEEGGPLQLGAVVDLGAVRATPAPPESEDHQFATAAARAVGRLDGDDYLQLLNRVSRDNLQSIFGPELERRGRSLAIEQGHGTVSLGVLRPQHSSELEVDGWGKLRLRFNDVEEPTRLGLTDLRFVEADHKTLKDDVIEDVQRRLRRGVGVLLMVGLARAFIAQGDDTHRHWLQVNGVCMEDRPTGDLP